MMVGASGTAVAEHVSGSGGATATDVAAAAAGGQAAPAGIALFSSSSLPPVQTDEKSE